MELKPEIQGVDTKFYALSHHVIQNPQKMFYNGVTVTDLKRDMCVTEELGGVRNNHAGKKTSLLRLGASEMSEIWSISPSSNTLFDKTWESA